MKLTFINVGYGDATLLTSDNVTILIDGGSANATEYNGFPYRIRALDFLHQQNIKRIDVLILTHIHEDHVCGLERIVNEVEIGEVWLTFPRELFLSGREVDILPDVAPSAILFTRALNATRRVLEQLSNVPVREVLFSPEPIWITNQLSCTILAPKRETRDAFMQKIMAVYQTSDLEEKTELLVDLDGNSNDVSMLLLFSEENENVLMCADSCPRVWGHAEELLPSGVTVLKLPHHGQQDSVSENFLKKLQPQVVVTTSASDRRYQSANREVYETIEQVNHKRPLYLFSDERSYEPYFTAPIPFRAITLTIDSGGIATEFIP